ncbi:MAG: transcription termination/antitermination protein NusA [Chloroflexi bacterium]|nr:MAG: transcription termination/antitermination protein NusA [Chloroflexota bacterium]
MRTEFFAAISAIAAERGIPRERIIEQVEKALVAAYRRSLGERPPAIEIVVKIDPVKGDPHVYSEMLVVDEVEDERFEISYDEARKHDPNIQVLEKIVVETTPKDFGRIAAQTAKQVILQGIRDVERDNVYSEFNERRGELMVGVVQRNVNGNIIIDLGKAEAILPRDQQVASDNYRPGTRIKVLLKEIRREDHGTRLLVTRTDNDLIKRIFEMEVPEILAGTVEIKSISREPGVRTKCAVAARQEGIDPVGACVGIRGVRIQNIVNELNGEKIDVVQWSTDVKEFIANALSPAQVVEVQIRDMDKAVVIVPDKQLSLAIGKEGQNVRLAAKLTKWKIDIKSSSTLIDEMREASEFRQAAEAESMALDVELANAKVEDRVVSEYGTFVYQNIEYGPLGTDYVGQTIQIRATSVKLFIYANDRLIASFMIPDIDYTVNE